MVRRRRSGPRSIPISLDHTFVISPTSGKPSHNGSRAAPALMKSATPRSKYRQSTTARALEQKIAAEEDPSRSNTTNRIWRDEMDVWGDRSGQVAYPTELLAPRLAKKIDLAESLSSSSITWAILHRPYSARSQRDLVFTATCCSRNRIRLRSTVT